MECRSLHDPGGRREPGRRRSAADPGSAAAERGPERMALGVIGGALGASIWTARGGGRIWLDAVAGTRIGGRIYGATLGPIVELSELAHPRAGAALGIWAFVGVTPF